MRRYRIREDESSTGTSMATIAIGALAGFAVGMFVAQRFGGFDGIANRFRRATSGTGENANQFDFSGGGMLDIEDEAEELEASSLADAEDEDFNGMDDPGETEGEPSIEERVLEAFNNDPILAERAIDIGAMGSSVIELAGWVDNDEEAEHAMTIARGVPGVDTVVNRLLVDDEEQQVQSNIRRFKDGDPALREARWEGQQVGTGKRRQGRSDEVDRHADPKPHLEDRWLGKSEALKNAADDL
jgi:BON domain